MSVYNLRLRERRARAASNGHRLPLVVITHVYLSGGWLDIFIDHYTNRVGADVVILDASGDSSHPCPAALTNERVQVWKLPKQPFSDWAKAHSLEMASAILRTSYDFTLVVDCDELVSVYCTVGKYLTTNLPHALFDIKRQPVIRCYGLNVCQSVDCPPYSDALPVWEQRDTLHPVTQLCKPVLMGEHHLISAGQHWTDTSAQCRPIRSISDPGESYLFVLFHLKHACRERAKRIRNCFQDVELPSHLVEYYSPLPTSQDYQYKPYEMLKERPTLDFWGIEHRGFHDLWNQTLPESSNHSEIYPLWQAPHRQAKFLVKMPAYRTSDA